MTKLMILTCPDVIASSGQPVPAVVDTLKALRAAGNPVGIISNGTQPAWFSAAFMGSNVQFLQVRGRQDGKIVSDNAKSMNLPSHNTVVLAGKSEDVQMAKNGGAVLVAAGWCPDPYVKSLGIDVQDSTELASVVSLCNGWNESWWFDGAEARYRVLALSDLSSINKELDQKTFAHRVRDIVKQGGPRLKSLLVTTARSLLIDGFHQERETLWSVYPSSRVTKGDSEVLSDFTHRLRTTVSKVQLARKDQPLFIRHSPSQKRSASPSFSRTDPTDQLTTMHLNPAYTKNLRGKHVIVIDDCATYGLSFGVAAALLRKAGAAKITGVALGKFGNQLKYYELDVTGNPFAPLREGDFSLSKQRSFNGTTHHQAQATLRSLLP